MAVNKNNLLRVTQMNAIYLDVEIRKSIQQIVHEACKHLPPGLIASIEPEINILLQVGILQYSVLQTGSTFGQQLLNIQYDNITTLKKAAYIFFHCFNYIKTRSELLFPRHLITTNILKVFVALKILDFLNVSLFLKTGVKPRLVERLLNLNQIYSDISTPRTFTSKYMARELLWNGFIEIIVYLLPLINYYKLKRLIRQCYPFYKINSHRSVIQDRVITTNSKCAHCKQNPILPHHMGCEHVFCYVCLKGHLIADSKYECPICEHRNPNPLCDRVNV